MSIVYDYRVKQETPSTEHSTLSDAMTASAVKTAGEMIWTLELPEDQEHPSGIGFRFSLISVRR